jgi:hypothetical protein
MSATTYQNLPTDVRVTGGTYNSGTTVFTNNTGGTFSVSGFSTGGPISTSGTSLYSNNPQTSGFSTNNTIAFGSLAGQGATNANNSNFLGQNAGYGAINASYSTLIGYQAGYAVSTSDSIGSNNIIIGANITLSAGTTNSLNIGNVLYGINTYSTTAGNPSVTPQATGKIGVGVVTPTANLHIAASTTASALMRLSVGPAPTSPNDGDIWLQDLTLTGLKIRLSGVTRTIIIT